MHHAYRLLLLIILMVFLYPSGRTQTPDPIPLLGHVNVVTGAAFSSNGSLAATASRDNTVKIFQSADGILLRTLGHFDDVNAVAFSPNGRQILTGSSDSAARLWEIANGREIRRFNHQASVTSLAFSPDGELILTGSDDNTAILWHRDNGEQAALFPHDDAVKSVAFSPSGLQIITGVADGSAFLWDITTILNPDATLTPSPTFTPTPTPTPPFTPIPTPTRTPTPTDTPLLPIQPTNTPTATSTPLPPISEPTLVFSFSFNSQNEFGREPGGFDKLPAGSSGIGVIPGSAKGLADGFGGIITTFPGQVELLTFPQVEVDPGLVAVRLSVRSTAPGAAISLALIDGAGDGTLTLHTQIDSGQFVGEYTRLMTFIKPKTNRVFPIFQIANLPGSEPVTVFIDRLEIFVLPQTNTIRGSFLLGE